MFKSKSFWVAFAAIILAVIGFGKLFLFNAKNSQTNPGAGNLSAAVDLIQPSASTSSNQTSTDLNQNAGQPNAIQQTAGKYQLMQSTGQLFANSPDYGSAYRIWPTFVSPAAKSAIDGFDLVSAPLGNNIFKVSLVAKARDYKTQTFIVSGNQKIYFIERSMGDDTPNQDYVYSDDYGIAVDANGYVLK